MGNDIDTYPCFTDYLNLSKESNDKVGFLTLFFKKLHRYAPQEDFVGTGGRIAKIWVLANKDTGYLLEIIWCASAKAINGSHLNYIQAIVNKSECGYGRPQPKKNEVKTKELKRYG